jgi:diguanylate cyclase (GGDEF)-like protein
MMIQGNGFARAWRVLHRGRPMGLATRFTVLVALLLVALTAAFLVAQQWQIRRFERAAFANRVADLVALINGVTTAGTLDKRLSRVRDVLDQVAKEPATRYVYAVELDGRLEPRQKLPAGVTLDAATAQREALTTRRPAIVDDADLQRVAVPVLAGGQVVALVGAGVSRKAGDAVVARARNANLLGALLFLAVALPLVAIFMRRIVAPLRGLTAAMERVAAGDLDAAVPVGRGDELGSLARAFERLTASLASSAETVQRLTFTDPVSGLPNRFFFRHRAETALAEGRPVGLLLVSLDRIPRVNAAFGTEVGDQMLIVAAQRLSGVLREERRGPDGGWLDIAAGDVVLTRFGADGLGLLLIGASGEEILVNAAQRVMAALRAPANVGEHSVLLAASAGLALSPADGETFSELLRNAQSGVQEARRQGGWSYRFARRELSARAYRLLTVEQELRTAVERGELEVWYQPQVALADGSVRGAEALARWRHPARGLLPPAEFIDIAEETGLLDAMDLQLLGVVARQSAVWRRAGLAPRLSVNVSATQCERPDFAASVLGALRRAGAAPEQIEIEITETTAMRNPTHTARNFAPLRQAGIRFAIDDFGTGYSNLVALAHMPFDILKIDRSFVATRPGEERTRVLVATLLSMARQLGFEIVAEGVETEEQRSFLLGEGCIFAQGYLFGRPMPAAEFERFCRGRIVHPVQRAVEHDRSAAG